ncbi:MAG: M3 family metallopeptidase [Saezia sp.]
MTLTHSSKNNPLLDFSDLPRFADIQPEHIVPAIDMLIEQANTALENVATTPSIQTWQQMSAGLDVATERLGRAWGAVNHLKAVKDSPDLREAVNEEIPKITAFWTTLGQDERLYAKYKAIKASSYAELNPAQKRALDLSLQSFILSGAELEGMQKERFAQIQEEQAILAQRFSEHLLDATDGWEMYTCEEELHGVPADIMGALKAGAESKGKTGYRLSLQPPIYIPLMQYANNRQLRETLYKAYATRASEFNGGKWDNSPVIDQIMALRQEEAKLLGYNNFSEVSLVPKMANSPQQVIDFLRELAAKALPYAKKDWQEMEIYAREHLGMETLNAWDGAYVSEKLKEQRYAFSDQEVKAYFPQPHVIKGLFKIIEKLFEVEIQEDTSAAAQQVWDSQVQLYRVERHGQLIGQLYTDLTAREGKRSGAWMDDVRGRWQRPDNQTLQTPVAQLVCNFASGVDGKPPLLTHDDVTTLFHESGHVFHHLLTQVSELDVSGISGVEWDAVELPSQFMENFCWEWRVLQQISAHVDTAKPLPRALYDKMIAAKNYQSGMQTARQIEFALFDMLLHSVDHFSAGYVQNLINTVRKEVAVIQPPAYNRFQCSFSHIFAGGYAAGYYSYKWAEVLSADAYAAFEEKRTNEENSIFDLETGRRFRQEILEVGASRPAMESFLAFRGREPSIEALLRHQGMSTRID